ncbi:hypothetical protein M513_12738 [Trichuris suis]|uniref:ISXO2-like transposase domain-containing protein n=1 Tax=Trichuris suis TaxID=68888 RepID=A0A085LN21_9BILA|nr:hypothetical protein M513_12738 [Trichuris suis]
MFDCSSSSSCRPSNSRPALLSCIGTIEVDESLFGKRKSNRSKMLGCQWVLRGVCHETGECFLEPVNHRRRSTLVPLIQGHALTGSRITTYAWRSYRLADHSYTHLCANHSASFVDKQTKANTQIIESLWKQTKHGGWTSACRKGYRPPLLCEKMVTCGQAKRGNVAAAAEGVQDD